MNSLKITIAISPGSGVSALSVAHDIELLRAGLLYGDRVKLLSPTSSIHSLLQEFVNIETTSKSKLSKLENYRSSAAPFREKDLRSEEIKEEHDILDMYEVLLRKKHLSKKELQVRGKLDSIFARMCTSILQMSEDLFESSGYSQILDLVDSQLLELETFKLNGKSKFGSQVITKYVEEVINAVKSNNSLPLLDEDASSIIREQINLGKLPLSKPHEADAKQIGLASSLFEHLPLFDKATLKEIIDIRRELESPLTRFRSAIMKYSDSMASNPWDSTFSIEANQVFSRDVKPAILDIEEQIRDNSYIAALASKFSKNPTTLLPPAIGVGLSEIHYLPGFVALALGLSAPVLSMLDVAVEWEKKQKEIQRNSLFFHYKAGKLLGS